MTVLHYHLFKYLLVYQHQLHDYYDFHQQLLLSASDYNSFAEANVFTTQIKVFVTWNKFSGTILKLIFKLSERLDRALVPSHVPVSLLLSALGCFQTRVSTGIYIENCWTLNIEIWDRHGCLLKSIISMDKKLILVEVSWGVNTGVYSIIN